MRPCLRRIGGGGEKGRRGEEVRGKPHYKEGATLELTCAFLPKLDDDLQEKLSPWASVGQEQDMMLIHILEKMKGTAEEPGELGSIAAYTSIPNAALTFRM